MSLDLYSDFMGSVVGQASFLFHISQQFLPTLEGIMEFKITKSKYNMHMQEIFIITCHKELELSFIELFMAQMKHTKNINFIIFLDVITSKTIKHNQTATFK